MVRPSIEQGIWRRWNVRVMVMVGMRRLARVCRQLNPDTPEPAPTAASASTPPLRWSQAEWAEAEARMQCTPLFAPERLTAARASFDRAAFLRDGYWVLPGVMGDATRRRWRAALAEAQSQHDAFLTSDWDAEVDWGALEIVPPPPAPPRVRRAAACGRSQELPNALRQYDASGASDGGWAVRGETMRRHGLIPEVRSQAICHLLSYLAS